MNARGHLSSETIDLLMLSGLDATQTNQAKAHIDACERCRTRWRELNDDKERFVQYVFPRTVGMVTSRVMATSWLDTVRCPSQMSTPLTIVWPIGRVSFLTMSWMIVPSASIPIDVRPAPQPPRWPSAVRARSTRSNGPK